MRKCLLLIFGIIGLTNFGHAQIEVDSLNLKKGPSILVLPAFGYSPETKFSFGAVGFIVFEDKKEVKGFYRPSSLTPIIIYTTNKQLLTKTELDLFTKSGLNINVVGRYYQFPNFYYGIGNDTDADVRDSYDDNFIRLEGKVTKPFNDKYFVGLRYDFQYNNIGNYPDSGLLANDTPNGLQGGRVMGLGPVLQYDTRNSTLYPTSGKQIGVAVTAYSEIFGSEYNYVLYSFDYRQYFKGLWPKNVIAFQYRTQLSSGGDLPFYKLNTIAGDNRLRGFSHQNVLRDQQGMYFQAESRQELFWRMGTVVFAGMGQVFNDFSELSGSNVRFVYGVGGRFQPLKKEKMNIRVDIGFTDDGQSGIFIAVREAF